MTPALADSTLADLVTDRPGRSRVFESFGLDYCCNGGRTLEQACAAVGQDVEPVLEKLAAFEAVDETEEPDFGNMGPTELYEHIVGTHHAYMKEELPALTILVETVARVHAENHPWLGQMRRVALDMFHELDSHLMKEERILFPMIKQLEEAAATPQFHCGSIENPMHVMELEHDGAGEALAKIRQLTNDFTPPEGACNKFRAMLERLEAMEYDLHRHIHKENSLLHPKARALAEAKGC
ncbi:MAG: iron-sulfur cluster repair di-iron protein [Planctomycetota bacterium]